MTREFHLSLEQLTLRPSAEWFPRGPGWFMARVARGAGYWLAGGAARELKPGEVIAAPRQARGALRASQLGPVTLQLFLVQPQYLNGMLTVAEQQELNAIANHPSPRFSILSADDPVARAFAQLAEKNRGSGLVTRSRLLQLWVDAIAGLLTPPTSIATNAGDLRARFRQTVGRMLPSELSACSLRDLSGQLHCSERHASRLFREQFGLALRTLQTELRLRRAQQLLATSDDKITAIAYESGYQHLGFFNTMFKKHFGMTPSEWRRRNGSPGPPTRRQSRLPRPAAFAGLLLTGLGLSAALSAQPRSHPTASAPSSASSPATPQPSGSPTSLQPRFEVRHYHVRGNTLLDQKTINRIFASATGRRVSIDQIRRAVENLEAAYRERGFVTVAVSLPQQQLTNATVTVQVVEAPLAIITVVNNRYFSSNNVVRALPSLRTNMLLNSHIFQRELDLANANRDRQIYPVLGPGPEPGTSALTLKVKDRLPLHGRFELNNLATPGTPELRMSLSVQYNNVWNLDHQVGAQYSFTPQDLKAPDPYAQSFFDDPLIANYSAYYRLPLGRPASVQHQVNAAPLSFGYSEVTHRFRLPPILPQPTLTFYGSRSTTDTGVQFGPRTRVTQGSFITIDSQDSGENLTLTENLGARVSLPFAARSGLLTTFSFGLDVKRYQLTSLNTNNFYVTTVITNAQGSQTIEQTVASPQPVRRAGVDYMPANAGLAVTLPDHFGATTLDGTANLNFLASDSDFARSAYTTNASAHFLTLDVGLSREQKIYRDWSVSLRANGQWADGPLIANEQFAIGGTQGVRGYREGEQYGDTGWRVLVEPRTPQVNIGMVDGTLPCWIGGSVFLDYGESYLLRPPAGLPERVAMWGAGLAFNANIGDRFDLHFTLGVPLRNTPQIHAGDPALYFTLGAQF